MSDNYAVNRPGRSDGDTIDDPIDRVAQKFKTGNEGEVQLAARQLRTKRGRMIENDFPFPAVNQRSGIEIFDTTDAK